MVKHHAPNVDVLAEQRLASGAVDLTDARPRQLVHNGYLLGNVKLRQPLGKRLPQRARADERRIRRQLHYRCGPPSPARVGQSEHIGVGHAGNAHESVDDFRRVHVLAAGDEHVARALAHVKAAIVKRRRIAREEEAVHGEGRPGVGVAAEHPWAAQGEAPETLRIRLHNAGRITRQKPHTSRELGCDQHVRHLARRLGHAIAGIHARLGLQGPGHSLRVQRAASEQHALVLGKRVWPRIQHILQHLVHHRDVGGVHHLGIAQHRRRVEALVDAQGPATTDAAHEHLEAAHMEKRQHRLPQTAPANAPGKHPVRCLRRLHEVAPGELGGLGLARRAGGEHNEGPMTRIEDMGGSFGEVDGVLD